MRARIVTVAAVVVSAASLIVAVWVLTLPGFAEPAGIDGHLPGWVDVVAPLAWTVTGATLVWLRPRNGVGALVLFQGTCLALALGASAYGTYGVGIADPQWPAARWVAYLGPPLWVPGFLLLITVLPAVYPDGRLPGPRWRLPVAATVVGIVLTTLLMLGGYHDVAPGPPPVTITLTGPAEVVVGIVTALSLLGGTVAIWVMTIARLMHARSPERQLLAWLVCLVVPFALIGYATRFQGFGVALPVAVAVGVLRYRLLGIEVVLRRGLVYAVLTLTVIGVYLVVTAIAGSRLDRGPLPGVVAAAFVAVGLTPLRERVQHGVDRLVYGDRSDPMRAVTRVGDGVAASGEPQDLLPTVLMNVRDAVRAPGACVLSPDGRVVAVHGAAGEGADLPLRVSGREVGTLRVSARVPGERYTDGDLRLLAALTPQVAVVVRALDLAEALEAERDRVVAATRAERDRLRRDLHDGLGPSLSGISLGLQALNTARTVGDEPTAADLLGRVRAEAHTAVGEVRRILDGLRPSALDAGLAAAIRRHADTVAPGVPVDLDLATTLPLPPQVETAAYRIAQEALTNVVRHAQASRARVALATADGALRIEVADDGRGLATGHAPGIGLASMRHRAEALGGTLEVRSGPGGTTVVATLPLETLPLVTLPLGASR